MRFYCRVNDIQNSVNPYKMADIEKELKFFQAFYKHDTYPNKSVGETSTNTTHRLG